MKIYVCPKCNGALSYYSAVRCIECESCGWTDQSLRACRAIDYNTAWDLAGNWAWVYAGAQCRIKGGRVLYEEAAATATSGGVVLKRLVEVNGKLHQINRWVLPEQEIELVDPLS